MDIPQGYKQTELGIIPDDWEVKRISDFTSIITGGTPSTLRPEYWGGNIMWMSSGELNKKFVFDVEGRITTEGLLNSSTHMIPPFCVLIGLAGQGKTELPKEKTELRKEKAAHPKGKEDLHAKIKKTEQRENATVKTAASATVTGVQAMARTPLLPTIKTEIITVTMPKQLRTTIPSHKLLWLIKNKIACLPIIYLLLTACHSNTVYHSYQSIPTTGWSKSDTLVYTLPASIPAGTYEMTIGIRHQESYPYRNLWMNISTNVKDTSTYTTDTLQLFLADKTGNWNGNGPGGLYQFTKLYTPSFTIAQDSASRNIRIVHIMTDNPLKGISDVGIRLEKP